jgi:hypothetical protein
VSLGGLLIRFLLGFAGSLAGLSLVVGFAISPARPEAHVLGAVAEGGRPIEALANHVASVLADKRVRVRCWSTSQWPRLTRRESVHADGKLNSATLGFADIGGTRINLSPTVCDGLADLVDRNVRPKDEVGRLRLAAALVTLTHEPQHSKGVAAEAVAECNAIQLAPLTARTLGVPRHYAAMLVQTYWRHYGNALPGYRSPECRKGGALDLHRPESVWP